MSKVKLTVEKIVIPTYPEPQAEDLPMFAENRVHQRSSGRPYPNKVVLEVERNIRIPMLKELYERKMESLHAFQNGKDIWKNIGYRR